MTTRKTRKTRKTTQNPFGEPTAPFDVQTPTHGRLLGVAELRKGGILCVAGTTDGRPFNGLVLAIEDGGVKTSETLDGALAVALLKALDGVGFPLLPKIRSI